MSSLQPFPCTCPILVDETGALEVTDDGALIIDCTCPPPRRPTEASGLADPALTARLAELVGKHD